MIENNEAKRRTAATRLKRLTVIAVTLLVGSAGIALTTPAFTAHAAASDTEGLFPDDQAPPGAVLDPERSSVEIGMRFSPKTAGSATGVQVYKISDSRSATPTSGTLWNSAGRQLAQVTFQQTNRTGWLSADFTTAVKLTVGQTYTVSAFMPQGQYAATTNYFSTDRSNRVLNVPATNNGVYRYDARSSFPTSTYRASNYWVDVAFTEASTSSPSPTPTASATPSPTPSPPLPSGRFPDETTTGVPAGVNLSPYGGPTRITQAGTVIDAKSIVGTVSVEAPNVTITRSSVMGNVQVTGSGSLIISDTRIDVGNVPGTGLEAQNYVADRIHITGGNRSAYCASNCTIRDSYVHGQMTDRTGVYHESGIRMEQNTTLIGNTITCDAPDVPPDAGCSAGLTGYGDFAPVKNNLIQRNLFKASTGGFCAYGGSSRGKPYSDGARDIRFIDNVFERGTRKSDKGTYVCGYWGPITDFSPTAPGNVWTNNTFDDGTIIRP